MHIVSQKQQEIQALKDRLFQLERLQSADKKAQQLSNELIEALRNQNMELQNTINEIQVRKNEREQLLQLRDQFNRLKQKNLQLEQVRSNLSSEIINMKSEMNRFNLQTYLSQSRTQADDSIDRSRSYASWRASQNETQGIAPALVDSRYTAINGLQEIEEEAASPLAERKMNLMDRIRMEASGIKLVEVKQRTYY